MLHLCTYWIARIEFLHRCMTRSGMRVAVVSCTRSRRRRRRRTTFPFAYVTVGMLVMRATASDSCARRRILLRVTRVFPRIIAGYDELR